MVLRWFPATCYCVIDWEQGKTGLIGKFVLRCRIHQEPKTVLDTYAHANANQIKTNEHRNETRDGKTISVPTSAGLTRERAIKEATR